VRKANVKGKPEADDQKDHGFCFKPRLETHFSSRKSEVHDLSTQSSGPVCVMEGRYMELQIHVRD